METKFLLVLLFAINCYPSCGAALRRTPKVYNALITTDENLTSSRAYPVIQPTIHESGLAHYPFGPYHPYAGYFSPPLVRFGQPIAPGLTPRQQLPFPLSNGTPYPPQFLQRPYNMFLPQASPGFPKIPPSAPGEQPPQETAPPLQPPPPQAPPQPEPQPELQPDQQAPMPGEKDGANFIPVGPETPSGPQLMPNEKLPIPLNQYGFPPALIPLPQNPYINRNGVPPMNLPPYRFNQFPLIYDPLTGFREQYLPPYEYFPSHTFAVPGSPFAPKKPIAPTPPTVSAPAEPAPLTTPAIEENNEAVPETTASSPYGQPQPETATPPTPDFETIKNGSKSKSNDVPDVPPPPIPTSSKSKQS